MEKYVKQQLTLSRRQTQSPNSLLPIVKVFMFTLQIMHKSAIFLANANKPNKKLNLILINENNV